MFCRGVRLSVATFDPAFKPSGLVHVKANRLGHITWTLPNKYTSHCCRALFTLTGSLDSSFLHGVDESKTYITVKNGESSSGFITTDLKHFNRVATIASNHTEDVQKVRYEDRGDGANRCSDRKAAETVASVVFWGGARLCTPSGSRSSMTVQTRASSTAAATQKGEKEPMETDNREEQHLKEPPASSSSLAPSSAGPGETEPEGGKPNKTQQLKKVFKEYGAVGVTFHVGISLISLGMFYLLVSSGFDMAAVLCKLGFSEAVVRSKMAAGTSTFVLAYAVHKLFAPARISITLVSVPFIVRHFRKTGLFKPPTPAP